jgi:hypothetical protein
MTEQTASGRPDDRGTEKRRADWANDAEAALEGVGVALREAWDASREARVRALESARTAAQQLGEAIDQGVVAARQTWEATQGDAKPAEAPTPHVKTPSAPLIGSDEGRLEEE